MRDATADIAQRVIDALQRRTPLRLRGGGTKDFYGNPPRGEVLDTRQHAGIVFYEPSELVITARGGTPISVLEHALAEKGQILPFEPPCFGEAATVGGCVASGLSGPRRASAGALRDFVLGVRIVDGAGRVLVFGGQVMKNVAGYDVSRLMAGSLGTLGVILDVSLKVLPAPRAETSLRLQANEAGAIEKLNRWAASGLPVSASVWQAGTLTLRLSGGEASVSGAVRELGGDLLQDGEARRFWTDVREHRHPFFSGGLPLWRFAVPPSAPPLKLPGDVLLEWGGGQRWLRSETDADVLRAAAHAAQGHATLFRAPARRAEAFTPLSPGALELHRRIKAVFDPAGILNPGRLYASL